MLKQRKTLLALVLCLLAATLLRVVNLDGLPPGVHFDEAANGILANEIGSGGERPLFITSYTGKEVLFFYLAGGVMRLVDGSVWGLRVTAVYLGLLTVAATYWLGLELSRDRRIALFAAALLAISFWHLLFSRLGFRAVSQPLLQALMVAAWLRGVRRQQTGWLLFSGACLGLSLYTYLAVRLFPLLLLLGAAPLFLTQKQRTTRLRQHSLLFITALLVAAPLLFFFWQNPDTFWVRITQVSPDGANQLTLGQSITRSLQMLFVTGDPYIRFNIPLKPLFDPLIGTLLLLGWLSLVWRFRRIERDWEKTAVLLLIFAPFIMLLPTALATNEIVPSNLRAIGLIPFVFYLPAFGLVWILQHTGQQQGRGHWLPPLLTLLIVTVGGGLTYRDYFQTWGQDAALFLETDGDLAAVSRFIDDLELNGETLYVASPHFQHPTVAFLSQRYGQIKWLPEGNALVFPFDGEGIVVYPAKSPSPDWAKPYLPQPFAEDDTLTAYRLTEPPEAIPAQLNANFSNAITLLDATVGAQTEQDTLPLTLFWQVNGRLPTPVQPFIHLEDAWGYRWSQQETFAYPSTQWERGDLIVQRVLLPLPAGLPPETYLVKVGLFDPATGSQLARFDENGRFAGNNITLSNIPLTATAPPDPLPTPAIEQNQPIIDGLRLVGNDPIPSEISSGEQLPLVLHWFAWQQLPQLTLRFELLREGAVGGRILGNSQPVHGLYPFPFWQAPQYVSDHQLLPIPDSIEAGQYQLNLRVLDGDGGAITAVTLGALTVNKTDRLFSEPSIQNQLDATFGNEIALKGYELTQSSGNEYELTLLWQAVQPPTTDYTVFVHALMPDGSCTPCAWQQDTMPQQNQYPTSRWQSGEFIFDSYQIQLPADLAAGIYPIEVGLYLADSGIRLAIDSTVVNTGDAIVIERIQRE